MNISHNETKQQINQLTQIQKQLDQAGKNNHEQKSQVTFEMRSPLFSFENNQLIDVEDPLSMNVTNGFEHINFRNVDNYIVSPKSIDNILLENNYRNKSSSIQHHILPSLNQNQSQKQRQSKIQSHNIYNDTLDKRHFNGDQSSIIKNNTQNQSIIENRQDASYDGISDVNDRQKIRQTKCSQIDSAISSIPKGFEFLVLKNVKKFVVKMKKTSRSLLFKSLSKPQFKLINDLSSNYNYFLKNGYFYLKESLFKLCWDIFILIFTVLLTIYIPLWHILNEEDFIPVLDKIYRRISPLMLILEIFVNLNSGIFKNGLVIKERLLILKNYYKNLMQISIMEFDFLQMYFQLQKSKDIFILILFMISIANKRSIISMMNYIVFFKYIDIGDKLDELESKFRIKDKLSIWIKLIKLEMSIFLVAHATCCIYLKIGIEQSKVGQFSWLEHYELISEPIREQYLNSLYYCLITMTTIGYGDITPKTLYEKSFILVVSVLACGIFAYTFSQISEIVKDQEKKKKEFSKNMQVVNREMNKKGISIPLQHKVRKYFEHLQKLEEKRSFLQSEMIEKLPKMLKEEFLLDTNKQIIAKHYIFSHLSQECTREIALIIRQRNYLTGEVIINEDEMDENLYFIWGGEVNLSKQYSINDQNNSETILTTLKVYTLNNNLFFIFQINFYQKKKDFFGHIGFFINNPNPYSAKAKTFVKLSYIRRQDFLSILERFPSDYERYCYFKDNASLYQQISILETKCISCGDYNHQLHMYPSVHQVTSFVRYGQNVQNMVKNQDINLNIKRKNMKFNSLSQAEVVNINIAEYWCLKADNDASIYSDIQDVINLQAQENTIYAPNPITEKDSIDSEEHQTPMLPFQQKLTFNSRDSRDYKKQTNQKINSDSFDITSESHIQNYQNFDQKQKLQLFQTVDFDNLTNKLKGKTIKNANDSPKRTKSEIMILQEIEGELNQTNPDKNNNSQTLKKEDISEINNIISIQNNFPNQNPNSQNIFSIPSIGLLQSSVQKKNTLEVNNPLKLCQDNMPKKRYMNLNGIVGNQEQNKENQQQSATQFLEISKEEDIENSNSNYSHTMSSSKQNSKSIHHLLIKLRAEKSKQYEKQIEHPPSKFNPVEQFTSILKQSQNQCISPLRVPKKKKVLKSQSTLDIEPCSADLPFKRNETKKPTQKSISFLPFETNISNLNPHIFKDESEHSRVQSYKNKDSFLKNYFEKRKESTESGLNEQAVQMNTQNLMNYIKMMQENQLILPLLENKVISIFEQSKKIPINQCNSIITSNHNNSYYANNSNRSHHDKDLISLLDQKKDKEKHQSLINKMQVMTPVNKKSEQKEQDKFKQIQNFQYFNSFFPVNENIIRRHSGNMDLDLLIYRKNCLLQMQQNQQFQGENVECDNEIDIDIAKSYKIYFPSGNLDIILNKYNKRVVQLNKKNNHYRIGRSSKSPIRIRDSRQSIHKNNIFKQKLNSEVKAQIN